MNILPFPTTRTLAQILAELMLAEGELQRLRCIRSGTLTPDEDARWSKLEDTIYLRRDEAKAMIEQLTGISWSQLEGANL